MLRLIRLMAVRHLLDRPVRTAITIVGVALGVALAVAIRTANVTVLASFERSVLAVAGHATLQISAGELGLDEAIITRVRTHAGVISATPVIHQHARVAGGAQRGQPVIIMGLDLLEAADLKSFRLRTDKTSEPSLEQYLSLETAFVGARLAHDWNLHPGDSLPLTVGTRQYRLIIQGVIESEPALATVWERVVIMDIASAQGLFGLVGRLDRIDLETDPAWSVASVAKDLDASLPASVTVSRPTRRNEQVEHMLRAFQLNLATLSAVGLLVGLLLVYNTVGFIVAQRRREIGIIRAYGMPRWSLLLLFLVESAAMGAIGGALGSVLGVVWANTLVTLLARTISDLYVPIPLDSIRAMLRIPSGVMFEGALLGMAISVAGAVAPALDGCRTAPARAVSPGDYEASRTLKTDRLCALAVGCLILAGLLALPGPIYGMPLFGYASALSLVMGLCFLAPVLAWGAGRLRAGSTSRAGQVLQGFGPSSALQRIALEHLARAPGRNGVTISALMIGVAIMLGVGIMIHSFRHTVELWIGQTILADIIVAPPSWLQGDESGMLARRIPFHWKPIIESVSGVSAVDPYREITVELQDKPSALVSRDLRLHAQKSRYLFLHGDSGAILQRTASEKAVIVSEALARSVGLRDGEALRLKTPVGERTFTVMGVFYDYATDGGKVVMDRELYRELWSDNTATVLAVYLQDHADPEIVRQRIVERVAQEGQFLTISNAELRAEILAIFDRTFAVTYALELTAVLIGLLGIINTLLISMLEQRRELATLRAIGASARQIARLVLWESAYLGLIGAALGTVGGMALAVLLIEVVNKQSFGWTIQLSLSGGLLLQAAGLAVAVSLLAAYWPARSAARQPIAEGLRYE
jgi:putative ABC transport system permease protein